MKNKALETVQVFVTEALRKRRHLLPENPVVENITVMVIVGILYGEWLGSTEVDVEEFLSKIFTSETEWVNMTLRVEQIMAGEPL